MCKDGERLGESRVSGASTNPRINKVYVCMYVYVHNTDVPGQGSNAGVEN